MGMHSQRRRATAARAGLEALEPRRLFNAAPEFTGGDEITVVIPERTTTFVTTVEATDADGDALTYGISDTHRFTLDPATLELHFTTPPDVFGAAPDQQFDVTVFVDDGRVGGFASQVVHVTVTNVNQAPVGVHALGGSGNVPVGYTVAEPTKVADVFVDDDFLGTNVVTLSGPDADLFSLLDVGTDRPHLMLSPDVTARLATPGTVSVTIDVDDPEIGGPVDASTAVSITSWTFGPLDYLPLVAPFPPRRLPVVTYSFESFAPGGVFGGAPVRFTDADKAAARAAIAAWDEASGLTFVEAAPRLGDFRLFVADLPSPLGGAATFPPLGVATIAVDVALRTDFHTWAHEVGHALGLEHAFVDDLSPAPAVLPQFNNTNFTVMAYNQGFALPTALGPLDRLAAAALYGPPNTDTFTYRPLAIEFTQDGVNAAASLAVSERLSGSGAAIALVHRVVFDSPTGGPERPIRSFELRNSAGGRFEMDEDGVLYVVGELDFDQAAFHDIVVRVIDGYGLAFDQTVRVNVFEFVPGPILGTEGDDDGVSFPRITGNDGADTILALAGNDVIVQSLGGDTIDGGDGVDTFLLALNPADYALGQNADGSVSFAYEVADPVGGGRFAGTDTVRNVELFTFADGTTRTLGELFNRAPTDVLVAGASVPENAVAGALAATLTGVDPDGPGDALTFELLDDAGGRFVLDGDRLLVAPGAALDFEAATSHAVGVRVTDEGGLAFERTFAVAVTNVAGRTVVGTNGGDRGGAALRGTGEEDTLRGLNGEDELFGGGGDDLLEGGNGSDFLDGGDGDDVLVGGRGADVLRGGAGDDVYVFTRGDGADVVLGFAAGAAGGDVIRLLDLGVTSFEQVLGRTVDVAGNAVILLNGVQIVLVGVSRADLTAGDFTFQP